VARLAGEDGESAHEGAADAEDVDVHKALSRRAGAGHGKTLDGGFEKTVREGARRRIL
jgi:hypothetical protein